MQAKDVPELPVLHFLSQASGWATHWKFEGLTMPSVADAMPDCTPEKVRLAKMKALLKRGLVCGCPCGCRGDWEISDAGRVYLTEREAG